MLPVLFECVVLLAVLCIHDIVAFRVSVCADGFWGMYKHAQKGSKTLSFLHFFTHSWSYLYHSIPFSHWVGLSKTKKFLIFSLQYLLHSLRVNMKLHLLKKLRFSSILIIVKAHQKLMLRKNYINSAVPCNEDHSDCLVLCNTSNELGERSNRKHCNPLLQECTY